MVCCLQYVAVLCSKLQYVAVHLTYSKACYNLQISFPCCSVLQCVLQYNAMCCSASYEPKVMLQSADLLLMLQCVAVWRNMLQHVAVYYNVLHCTLRTQRPATICRSLSHVAVCCSVCCSILQYVAIWVAICCSAFHVPKGQLQSADLDSCQKNVFFKEYMASWIDHKALLPYNPSTAL